MEAIMLWSTFSNYKSEAQGIVNAEILDFEEKNPETSHPARQGPYLKRGWNMLCVDRSGGLLWNNNGIYYLK